jgi:hypothetical protein
LNASGIAQDQVCLAHALDELAMAARLVQRDVPSSLELFAHVARDVRIRVKNEVDLHRKIAGELAKRGRSSLSLRPSSRADGR